MKKKKKSPRSGSSNSALDIPREAHQGQFQASQIRIFKMHNYGSLSIFNKGIDHAYLLPSYIFIWDDCDVSHL